MKKLFNIKQSFFITIGESVSKFMRPAREVFFSDKDDSYEIIDKTTYLESFGVGVEKKELQVDFEMVKAAYTRACENRDFEIDKFWSRAAYFWAFIAAIFTAYFALLNHKNSDDILLGFIILCLNCMGILFSIAWHLVMIGSKQWQENWELHIDRLEDYVSGPLYKTIFFKKNFYSVSKINHILSVMVITVWIGILGVYLHENHKTFFYNFKWDKERLLVILPLFISLLFILSMITGYARKSYKLEKGHFIRRKPNNT